MATNKKSYPNLMGGTWKISIVIPLEDRNLSDHNEIIGLFPKGTLHDTKSAIQAAGSAFAAWSRTPAPGRGAILDKASQVLTSRLDEIATALTREEGKTLAEAIGEAIRFGLSADVVKIDEPSTGLALNAPFGGSKRSSANTLKKQGQAAMDFYTRIKTIYVNHG